MILPDDADDSGLNEVIQILKWIAPFATLVWSATFIWAVTEDWQWVGACATSATAVVTATLFGEPSSVRKVWAISSKCVLTLALLGLCFFLLYAGVLALIVLLKAVLTFLYNHIVIVVLGLCVAGSLASVLKSESTGASAPNAEVASKRFSPQSSAYRTHTDSGRRWLHSHERQAIWKESGKSCYHCGKKLASSSPKSMHVDHLIPYSLGGTCDDSNLVASCPRCNLQKGNRLDFDPTAKRKRKRRRKT
jgi:5-methylcytosine-specific restriction endonuclease McrA